MTQMVDYFSKQFPVIIVNTISKLKLNQTKSIWSKNK
jgi:hypothetical protein